MFRYLFLCLLASCIPATAAVVDTSGDLTPGHRQSSFTIRAFSNQTDPVEKFTIAGAPDWITNLDGSDLDGTYDIDGSYSAGYSRSRFISVKVVENWKANRITEQRTETFTAGGISITVTQSGVDNIYTVTTYNSSSLSYRGGTFSVKVNTPVYGSPVHFPQSTGQDWVKLQSIYAGSRSPYNQDILDSSGEPVLDEGGNPVAPPEIVYTQYSGRAVTFNFWYGKNWEPNRETGLQSVGVEPFTYSSSANDTEKRTPYTSFSGYIQDGVDNTYTVATYNSSPLSYRGGTFSVKVNTPVYGSPVHFPQSTGQDWVKLQSIYAGSRSPYNQDILDSSGEPVLDGNGNPVAPPEIIYTQYSRRAVTFNFWYGKNWEPNRETGLQSVGVEPFTYSSSASDTEKRTPYTSFSGYTQAGVDNTYSARVNFSPPTLSHSGGQFTIYVDTPVYGSPVFFPKSNAGNWARIKSLFVPSNGASYSLNILDTDGEPIIGGDGNPVAPPETISSRYYYGWVGLTYHYDLNWSTNFFTDPRPLTFGFSSDPSDDQFRYVPLTQLGLDNTYIVEFAPESGSYLGGALSGTIYGSIQNEEFAYSSQAPWLTTDPDPGTGFLTTYAGNTAPRRYKATIPFTYPENYDFAAFTPAREGSVSVGANPVTFTQQSSGFEILSARQEADDEETARWVTVRYKMGEQREENTVLLSVKRDGDDTFIPVHECKYSPGINPVAPGDDLVIRWDASGFAKTLSEEDRIIVRVSDTVSGSLGFYAESDPFKLEPNCGACAGCGELAGNGSFGLNERGFPSMSLPLGENSDGTDGGTLWLDIDNWDEIGTPASVRSQLFGSAKALPAPTALIPEPEPTQYRTDNALVDVVTPATPDGTWQLHYYDAATSLGTFDPATGTHDQSSATPYHTVSFARSAQSAPFDPITLTISESGDLGDRTTRYSSLSNPPRWSHSVSATPTGPALRTETVATSISGGSALVLSTRTTDRQLLDASGTVLSRTETTSGSFPSGYRTLSERRHIIAADGTPGGIRTTTWNYDEDRFSPTFGKLLERTNDFDQSWTRYTYDSLGRTSEIRRNYQDAGQGSPDSDIELATTTYEEGEFGLGSATDRAEITTLTRAGTAVSRTFTIRFGDQLTAPYIAGGGNYTYSERWDITATDPEIDTLAEALAGTGTLTTKTRTYTGNDSGTRRDQFTTRSTLRPDGTLSISETTANGTQTWFGSPASGGNSITEGTHTIALTNPEGNTISSQTFSLPEDLLIASETALNQDALGRVTESESLGGLRTTRTYSCCGLESETDASGITTTYSYDALRRLRSSTRAGITSTTVPDPLGRVVSSTITGTASGETATLTASTTQDSLGLTTTSTDPLARVSTTTESTDPVTGRTTTTSTYPDGGTRIQERHADGRIYQVTGTAVSPWLRTTYDFGDLPDGTTVPRTTATILDPATGIPTGRYTHTYTDFAGRVVRTELPPLAASGVAPATTAVYNTLGQLTTAIDADGITTLFEYDSLGRRTTTATDANSNGTIDLAGSDRVTRTTHEIGTYQGRTVSTTHTALWKDTGSATPFTLTTTHTAADGLDSWTIAYPGTSFEAIDHTSITLDATARTRTVVTTSASGPVSTQIFTDGRLTASTLEGSDGTPIGSATLTYDPLGRPHIRQENDATTTSTYDLLGRPLTSTLQASFTIQDGSNASTENVNQLTSFAYVETPGTGTEITTTLPDGLTTTTHRDLAGRTLSTTGARTTPSAYTYTPAGQVETLTTAPGTPQAATTAWLYDLQGRSYGKAYEVDIAAPATWIPETTATYSPAGRLYQRTNARGTAIAYGYHPGTADLENIGYNDGETTNLTFSSYTRFGAPTTITDATGTRTLGIHATLPALESESGALGYTTARTYGAPGGRRTGLTITAPSGQPALPRSTTDYTYDTAGRISHIINDQDNTHYEYDTHSPRPTEITRTTPDSYLHTINTFDPLGRTTNRSLILGNAITTEGNYHYNNANQLTTAPDHSGLGQEWDYQYDALGQLTNATLNGEYSSTPIPGSTYTYGFDSLGNRLTTEIDAAPTTEATYTPNTLNQYDEIDPADAAEIFLSAFEALADPAAYTTTVTVNGTPATEISDTKFHARPPLTTRWQEINVALNATDETGETGETLTSQISGHLLTPGTAPFTPTYDADGNLLNDNRFTYTWDAENRLTTAQTSAAAIAAGAPDLFLEFTYDYRSRRTEKRVTTDNTATSHTRFLYDDTRIIAQLHCDPLTPTTVQATKTYTWGLDLSGTLGGAGDTSGLIALHHTPDIQGTATTTYLPTYDGNGNITTWVNGTTEQTAAQQSYTPFGKTTAARYTTPEAREALATSGFAFSTRYQDAETGLYDYGFRFYHPELGRWLSRDPIAEDGGLNLYGFNYNDPINYVDFLGLDSINHADPAQVRGEKGSVRRFFYNLTDRGTGGITSGVSQTNRLGDVVNATDDAFVHSQILSDRQSQVLQQQKDSARKVLNDLKVSGELALGVISPADEVLMLRLIATYGLKSARKVFLQIRCLSRKSGKSGSASFSDANERAIAEFLEERGQNVRRNPLEGVEGAGRQGDAFISGIKHEFKTLDPGATANTIRNRVTDSIRRGGQAREIVIDARASGLDFETATQGAFKALGVSRGKLDGLTIIGDGFFFRHTPK